MRTGRSRSRRFDPDQWLPGVDLLAGIARTPPRRCRPWGRRPGAPSSSLPSSAMPDRLRPRRQPPRPPEGWIPAWVQRGARATGIVGRRVARRHDESVLTARHEDDIAVDLGLDELQCRQPLVGQRLAVDRHFEQRSPIGRSGTAHRASRRGPAATGCELLRQPAGNSVSAVR